MYFASFSVFFAINQVLGHFKENTRSLQLVCAQLRYVLVFDINFAADSTVKSSSIQFCFRELSKPKTSSGTQRT